MRAVYVTFYGIFITAVIAIGSSDYPLTETKNYASFCQNYNLSLDLSGNDISKLGKNSISSPFITCLNLQGNQIEKVEKGAFDGLPALRYLNMAGNNIVDLTSFGGHENLETLILANQSYYYGNDVKFKGIYRYLQYLDLRNNKIHSIDWIIGENFDYKDLSIQIPRLITLYLSNNKIKNLFTNDFSSTSLSIMFISISNNQMEFANLRYLKNVALIWADNNKFQYLHKNHCEGYSFCISDMPKLQMLFLSNNELIEIDREFFKLMSNLIALNLSSNSLNNNVDGLFDDCISLQNLNLDNNRLTNISVFKKQSNLYIFSAKKNNIEYINSDDLINMTNLRQLHLSNNNISNIDKNAFSSLNLLEELHLAYNFLTNLPAEWSNNLKSLRYLDVTGNKFKYMESLSLSKTLPLTELYLLDSKIISFSPMTLLALPENVTIYLAYGQKEINLKTNDEEINNSRDF